LIWFTIFKTIDSLYVSSNEFFTYYVSLIHASTNPFIVFLSTQIHIGVYLGNLIISKTQLILAFINDAHCMYITYVSQIINSICPGTIWTMKVSADQAPYMIAEQLAKNYYFKLCTDFTIAFITYCSPEVFLFVCTLLIYCLCLFYFAFFLCLLLGSIYNNSKKDEKITDLDHITNTVTTESEKEITAFDDILMVIIIIMYMFGWYFFNYFWSIIFCNTELALLCFFLALMYFVIIGIPTFLIYEFGINFLLYLKGVATSSVLFVELIYDYIAVLVFYTRIIVQGVRLVLMVFVYASMHDLVMLNAFADINMLGSDILVNSNTFYSESTYYFFVNIPASFFYLVYEIFHVYFVVTVQTVAFFAIVFWLFLFLYSFFVLEKQESYFGSKR